MDKLGEILYLLQDRQFNPCIDTAYMMCQISKTFRDCQLTYCSFTLLGCLLMHLGFLLEAKKLFEVVKDVALDSHNWCVAMQSYEWIGRAF